MTPITAAERKVARGADSAALIVEWVLWLGWVGNEAAGRRLVEHPGRSLVERFMRSLGSGTSSDPRTRTRRPSAAARADSGPGGFCCGLRRGALRSWCIARDIASGSSALDPTRPPRAEELCVAGEYGQLALRRAQTPARS
jgi:hypothetical protein